VRFAGLLVVAVALVLSAPLAAASIRAKLTTSTPTPVVDQPWRFTLTVKNASGAPLTARAKLQLLLGETVVGCWKGGAMVQCFGQSPGDWITFRGRRTGVLRFPAESLGVKLTFQAVVRSQRETRRLRAAVTVRPAP
jgi:hypothetical protein